MIQIESFEECLEHIIPVNFTESNQLSVPHFRLINIIYDNIVVLLSVTGLVVAL